MKAHPNLIDYVRRPGVLADIFRYMITGALCVLGFSAPAASLADQQILASAHVGFAFRLLREISREQPGSNIFISPYGAFAVLQMACNGAGGQTKSEMQRLLGTTNLLPEVVNAASLDFDRFLNNKDTNIILNVANAIWYRAGIPVNPGFISCNRQFFGATVDGLNFDDPRSAGIINAWASEKTHGKIRGIADGLVDKLTGLFLANAVYFKGKWEEPFDVKNTKDRPFHLQGGRRKMAPMMEQTHTFRYRRGSGYQAVRLAYQGWSLGMYVFLPDVGSSPAKLLGIMNGDKWQRVTLPGFNDREGTIVLPKFRLEYGVELKQPLKALGMKASFDKADFSGISEQPLSVSAVRQLTFVEINEEGTEAAAATGLTMKSGLDLNPPKPFEMIVDRPFLFFIADEQTKIILFIGAVFDPGAS